MPIISRIAVTAARAYGFCSSLIKDIYFNYVTILLPGNGTNGAQNNTFLDSSTNNFTITRNGNTTQGTFSPFSQTGWSTYLSSSYLTAGTTASNFLCTGSATGITATFEAWVYPTAYNTGASAWMFNPVHAKGGTYFNFGVRNGAVRFYWYDGGYKNVDSASTSDVPLNTWTHIAVTISGTTIKIYVNGALNTTSATYTGVAAVGSGQNELLGVEANATTYFSGYISNYRLNNTVVYSAAFTPSTTPLTAISGTQLLVHQSNRFIDNSTNAFALTATGSPSVQAFSPFAPTAAYSASTVGGSGYFDGSGDYLTVANNAALNFGSSNFTVEFWISTTQTTSNATLLTKEWGGSPYTGGWSIQLNGNSSSAMTIYWADVSTGATFMVSSSTAYRDGGWHHVAWVRNGSAFTLYLDGVSVATATNATAFGTNVNNLTIGNDVTFGPRPYLGYMADLRIVKGTAVYTANFTPPTAPLTAITNTSLLLNYTNGGITDATAKNDLETVGNAQISTTQSKWGGSSMAFDGSGDWLSSPNGQNYNLGSGNFTIECWVYANNLSSLYGIFGKRVDTGVETKWVCSYINITGTVQTQLSTSGSAWLFNTATTSTITSGSWNHIAWVRNGADFSVYVNGVKNTMTTTLSGSVYTDASALIIGATGTTGAYILSMNGYVDDFRITKGIARYTAAFTPPTGPFPLQ